MSEIDINTPRRSSNSKVQLENQQETHRADFRDARWQQVVYPNQKVPRPFHSATIFEIVVGVILLVFGLIAVFRLFFIPTSQRTSADTVLLLFFYAVLGIVAIIGSSLLIIRAWRYFRESGIYVLPNGFPVSIKTITSNYKDLSESILTQPGYFTVESARAANPIVAPGEINTTYSPQVTYAPSNMPREQNDGVGDDLLKRMLSEQMPTEDEIAGSPLPTFVNFFDHIDAREPGYIIAGITESDELFQVPIMKMFNHLVGGAVGSGKSIYLRSLVFQLIQEADASDIPLELGLADIENNTFPEFRGCRHVRWYAGNYVEIEHMTSELLREVERRKIAYETLTSTPKDIERYNILAGRENMPELPIIVVFYDEFSALMHRSQAQQKRILSDVLQLALRARKYGIFLVIAGQTFKADLIDSAVLGQFGFNVSFKVRNGQVSLSILGETGAEDLKHPGEALMKMKDGTIKHVQGLHIEDDELLSALEEFRDPESKNTVPELARAIIAFAHEKLDDQVKFREVELHFREQGIARSEVLDMVTWMDEHKYTIRGAKNSRQLNWHKINGEK